IGAHGSQEVVTQLIASLHDWTGGGVPSDDETVLVVGWEPEEIHATAAGGGHSSARRGVDLLGEANRRGIGLHIEASSITITGTLEWVRSRAGLRGLSEEDLQLLGTGLFEVCSNIAEHGYGNRPDRSLSVWWLPP